MNHFLRLALLVVLPAAWPSPVATASEPLEQTITYLLQYMADSRAVFIRNGSEHTPQEAVDHIQDKYHYYQKEIKTPEDFIRLAATRSELSGQPYRVRPPGEKERRLDEWLRQALAGYRRAHHLTGR